MHALDARIVGGKAADAFAWAMEIAGYINEADERYQAQIAKVRAAGLFIGSSIVDRLSEVL